MNPRFMFSVLFFCSLVVPPVLYASEEAWHHMNEEVANLYRQGDIENAVHLAEESLHYSKTNFGPEHLNTAKALNNLANLYFRNGRFDEAEWMYEDAIRIEEKTLGLDSLEVADSLYNFAMLDLYRKQTAKARTKLEKALAIRKKQAQPDAAAIARLESALKPLQETESPKP